MQALKDFIKRKLSRVHEDLDRAEKQRARTLRRRQRVADWERLTARPLVERNGDAGRRCVFCESMRGWLSAQWQRLVFAAQVLRRGIKGFLDLVCTPSWFDESVEDGAGSNRVFRRHRYPGSRNRFFQLRLPAGYRDGTKAPLLMVLHGCRQTNADIRRTANFDEIADREGFAVVYPYVTSYTGMRIRNCWGWWLESEIRPGAGEVEDLWHIIEQVKEEISVDRRRIHVAGLSSGGGMAVAMMVTHSDKIASGAAVAGVAYSETPRAVSYGAPTGVTFKTTEQVAEAMKTVLGDSGRPSPIFIVHSCADPVVDIRAAENIRDSWARIYDIDTSRAALERSGITNDVHWLHARYKEARKRSSIETFFMKNLGHGWYGGSPGTYSFPEAPNTSELMWGFFKRHPLHSESRSSIRGASLRRAS